MKKVDLHQLLDGKWEDGTRPKDLYAQRIARDPAPHIESIVLGLRAGNRRIENGLVLHACRHAPVTTRNGR